MKRFLTMLACLGLLACTHFEKPGVSPMQQARDEAECKYEADKATANGGNGVAWADVKIDCMRLRGYGLF
jgi:hypothetical protein